VWGVIKISDPRKIIVMLGGNELSGILEEVENV
jgi:hypothetical protein